MQTVQLTEVGDALGIVLPQDFLEKFQLGIGKTVYLVEAEDGYVLTPIPPQTDAPAETNAAC
ncbi:AbrB/MazE/SpoVT family DNA-binding domain-containing protein [Ramlibacter albus]|uniref:AbrB/MazE/SpoVT family DNA-binding domain-containing protein n=1 Tax=Ramlibacter albus TaxID=2079448 RepID=A0A923M7X0_9BURK|nr:AbrB/MazE/SpoVT family DNA-binding domain-containing protein [Ramlibacter albus]MBC5765897.1 AbrB/MazE/SpoVT family DNA-binding domain-containing protein [Ramlibacter albus]